jgi:diaminopimelate decarboxylase
VGKCRAEMVAALTAGIFCFNVESEPELAVLSEVAVGLGLRAPVSVRVNPDVDAGTHAKISTGKYENKFGVPITRAPAVYAAAAALPGIAVHGVDMHIGSQITDLAPFADAARLLAGLARELLAAGHPLRHIDFGGGLGIPYRDDNAPPPDPAAQAATLRPHFAPLGLRPVFEIGRMIVGNAGILLTRVLYVKHSEGRTFVIVDAAMNDLARPALYDAYHDFVAVRPTGETMTASIVGPVCETGDTFARDRVIDRVGSGDLAAFRTAGAYGATMASTYNSRSLVPEVLVDGDRYIVVADRIAAGTIMAAERVPDWID